MDKNVHFITYYFIFPCFLLPLKTPIQAEELQMLMEMTQGLLCGDRISKETFLTLRHSENSNQKLLPHGKTQLILRKRNGRDVKKL